MNVMKFLFYNLLGAIFVIVFYFFYNIIQNPSVVNIQQPVSKPVNNVIINSPKVDFKPLPLKEYFVLGPFQQNDYIEIKNTLENYTFNKNVIYQENSIYYEKTLLNDDTSKVFNLLSDVYKLKPHYITK